MKALNQKQRRKAKWNIVILFVPIILIVSLATTVHFQVMALQGGDLYQKSIVYDKMLEAQAKKGELVDGLISELQSLRDSSKSFVEHQNAQKSIRNNLLRMQEIEAELADTQSVKVRMVPAIYDSLGADILLIQSTRDSIKTCDEQIKNLTFQLQQCLDALAENLGKKTEKGK